MATYYFDANGATAGFGTLTGNWNPSTALWSTNSAGTSATSAVTFTNADIAQFGFTGTAGTAGTATITTGVTNTVNQVATANLAGLQTIAAAGTGALALAGTTPTINVGSAGGLAISAPITGTAGFTKAGVGTLFLTNTSNDIRGTVSITGGFISLGPTTGGDPRVLSSAGNVNIDLNGGSIFLRPGNASYTFPNTYSFTSVNTINHLLDNQALGGSSCALVYPSGAIANFAGHFRLYTLPTATNANISVTSPDMIQGALFQYYTDNVASPTVLNSSFVYTGTGGTYDTPVEYAFGNTTNAINASTNAYFYANNTVAPIVFSTSSSLTLKRNTALTGTATFHFSGNSSSTLDNEFRGVISKSADALAGTLLLAITKSGTSRWILSGTNTYTGANQVSAGTLVANNNSALGAAAGAASSITTGATLEIASGITVNKASTQWTLNGNTAANGAVYAPSGNAGLTAANFVLGTATTDIKADAGATLTLTSAGAISGNFTLRHVGTGTAVLAQTAASTFTALNIQSGTVSVSKELAAGGASSGIGNGSTAASNWLIGSTAMAGTFRYTGAASSTNRNFTIGTAGSTFDASGSGVLTLTGTTPAFSAANTACTLTLAGISGSVATPNTSAMVLADNGTGAVGLTKTGTGFWRFTASQTYTGATTITGGSMSFGETNIATNVVFNGPGTLREVVLNGVSKTITCSAGASDVAELISTSSHNTITGSTNVTTGTLKLTTEATAATKPVKVLGDTDVVVTSKLQTSTGTLQRGQMRYGGNLTFQGGSTFIIGG